MKIQFGDQNFEVPEQLVGNHDIEITAGDDGSATLELKPVRLETAMGDMRATEMVENPLIIGHDADTFKKLVAEGVSLGLVQHEARHEAQKISAMFAESSSTYNAIAANTEKTAKFAQDVEFRVWGVDMSKDGGDCTAATVMKTETNGTAVPDECGVSLRTMDTAKHDFSFFVRESYHNTYPQVGLNWDDDLEALCKRLSEFVMDNKHDKLVVSAFSPRAYHIINVLLPVWASLQSPDWKKVRTKWCVAPVSDRRNLIDGRRQQIEKIIQSDWFQKFRHVCTVPTLEVSESFRIGGSPCGVGFDMAAMCSLGGVKHHSNIQGTVDWIQQVLMPRAFSKSKIVFLSDGPSDGFDSILVNQLSSTGWDLWEPPSAKSEPVMPVEDFGYTKTVPIVHFDVTRRANGGLQGKARDYDKRFFIHSTEFYERLQPSGGVFQMCVSQSVRQLANEGKLQLPAMVVIHHTNGRIQEITVESPLDRKPKFGVGGIGWSAGIVDDPLRDETAEQNGRNYDRLKDWFHSSFGFNLTAEVMRIHQTNPLTFGRDVVSDLLNKGFGDKGGSRIYRSGKSQSIDHKTQFHLGQGARRSGKSKSSRPRNLDYIAKFFWRAGWEHEDYALQVTQLSTDLEGETTLLRAFEDGYKSRDTHEEIPPFVGSHASADWNARGWKLRDYELKEKAFVDKFEDVKTKMWRMDACMTAYHSGYNGLSFSDPVNMECEATEWEWYDAGRKLREYELKEKTSPQLPAVSTNPGGKRISANDELYLRGKGWLHACDGRDDKEYYWVDPATGEWFAPRAAHIIQQQRDTLTVALYNDGTLFKSIPAEDEQYLRDREWQMETIGNRQYWIDHATDERYPACAAYRIQRHYDVTADLNRDVVDEPHHKRKVFRIRRRPIESCDNKIQWAIETAGKKGCVYGANSASHAVSHAATAGCIDQLFPFGVPETALIQMVIDVYPGTAPAPIENYLGTRNPKKAPTSEPETTAPDATATQ